MNIEQLWTASSPATQTFPGSREGLPELVRRYLDHAIASRTVLANAVRLQMHGEIKIKGWAPFHAEQVIVSDRGMIWNARTTMAGLPVSGSDVIVDGVGRGRWKLLGLIPVMNAQGEDVDRSAAGRMAAESIWVPSLLARESVGWTQPRSDTIRAGLSLFGFETDLDLTLTPDGEVRSLCFGRWGNPNGLPFGLYPFGGDVEEEKTFGGFTIPSRLQIGWHYGTDRFKSEGEFFRATIDDAQYR